MFSFSYFEDIYLIFSCSDMCFLDQLLDEGLAGLMFFKIVNIINGDTSMPTIWITNLFFYLKIIVYAPILEPPVPVY